MQFTASAGPNTVMLCHSELLIAAPVSSRLTSSVAKGKKQYGCLSDVTLSTGSAPSVPNAA